MKEILAAFKLDMQLRGFTITTQEAYLKNVRRFIEFHWGDVRKAELEDIKRFLSQEILAKGLTPQTFNQYGSALRFFFSVTLEKEWARDKIPYAREPKNLPDVLSGTEVLQVLQAFKSHKHKTIAIVCYGAGLRVSEAISLRTIDIDSKRLVIHVREGKGQKDRQVTLSPRLLTSLRSYWVKERPKGDFLFPGRGKSVHITKRAFCRALRIAVAKAGIKKRVTPHVLRHSYATHMIESGADLRSVQLLLGHSSMRSTTRYVHLTNARRENIGSPLELLGKPEGEKLG